MNYKNWSSERLNRRLVRLEIVLDYREESSNSWLSANCEAGCIDEILFHRGV